MSTVDKVAEIDEASVRARQLALTGNYSVPAMARRMAAEFHICIYALGNKLYGSFYETDKIEVRRQLL